MKEQELKDILEKHLKYLNGEEDGKCANLRGVDLSYCELVDVNLAWADLQGANLSHGNLRNINLECASLNGAYLRMANLCKANLHGANLRGANLIDTNLNGANLSRAYLDGANLNGANLISTDFNGAFLSGIDLNSANIRNVKGVNFPYSCPDFGAFIGWKRVKNYIVQLEIPEDAKRLSATGRKCRCNKAKVLSIQNNDGTAADVMEVVSSFDNTFIYKIGEIVSVENFDKDRWNECSTGIHFFINRQEAIDYSIVS